MKRQFIYGAMILALASAASSCSDDQIIDSTTPSVNQHKVAVSVATTIGSIGGNSRATLGGENGLTPVWQTDDTIAVQIDNTTEISKLTLSSGAGTRNGKFTGLLSEGNDPKKMYFFYPTSAAADNVVDLTRQNGSHTNEMVMFASADYSAAPSVTFQNKTSILKLNIPVPDDSGWTQETKDINVTIIGAYSRGKLTTDGTWSDLEAANIQVSDVKVSEGKLTGYAVVIPGSEVSNLYIVVNSGSQNYVTRPYTSLDVNVSENKMVTINQPLLKTLVWTPGTTKKDDVTDYLGTDVTDLTIVPTGEMQAADFSVLKNALNGKSGLDFTLLSQTDLPYPVDTHGALENCKAIVSVYAPNLTSVGKYCLKNTKATTDVSLPKLKAFNEQILASWWTTKALQRACFASLTDFTNAKDEFNQSLELAFGATAEFTFADGADPLVLFNIKNTSYAAATTLYLNEEGYEYKNNVDLTNNTWRGVTFKEIKKYSDFKERANGGNPPSMGYNENNDGWK